MNYQDKWTRYHNKPTNGTDPSSNNGWIFTAYAAKLGLPLDHVKIAICFESCIDEGKILTRHPKLVRDSVPISRDEILGMAYLGLLKPKHLKGFSFSPYPIPKFSLKELIKQIREVKGKHRNYLWQNNMNQLYRFAFTVPLTDRAFVIEHTGMKVSFISKMFYKAIAKADSMLKKESAIRWLKYGKSLKAFKEEFPEDHPFRK